jgi:hypothetical protein
VESWEDVLLLLMLMFFVLSTGFVPDGCCFTKMVSVPLVEWFSVPVNGSLRR